MASLEKGRKLLERKGPASVAFSCLMVTGTVMLTLLSPSDITEGRLVSSANCASLFLKEDV
jgi:hypothetical protein